jgi:GNAT superfamily N-acetyltransferase
MYRRGGWRDAWQTVAERTIDRVFRRGRFLVIVQDLDTVRDAPPPPDVAIRLLAESDWPALASLVPQRDLDRFRLFVDAGHACFIAWRGDQPIGYTWCARRLEPNVSILPVPLPPHAAYLWDVYVPVSERRSGVGSALITARLRLAREWGFREGWRIVAPTNRPSLRTVDKTGGNSRVIGEITFVKLLSRLRARYRPLPADLIASSGR